MEMISLDDQFDENVKLNENVDFSGCIHCTCRADDCDRGECVGDSVGLWSRVVGVLGHDAVGGAAIQGFLGGNFRG